MKRMASVTALWVAGMLAAASATADDRDPWAGYLDYAYVFVSAEPEALRARLADYAREAGVDLRAYVGERYEARLARGVRLSETEQRRRAIGHLLRYRAEGSAASLAAAIEAVAALEDRLEQHENRYWTHTVRAQHALHLGDARAFSQEMFDLWYRVIVPLEATHATHEALFLDRAGRASFVGALPYLYENVARAVLLDTQRSGLEHGLDPLAALLRFLEDGRIGAHPDVIPLAASSEELLEQVVTRLEGPESDGGSLSFTLALFEAARRHEEARALLADEGLSERTQEAVRVAIGAYDRALRQADTLQGQCAVYTRVLRQLGEIYAAKQRLAVEPEIDIPFSIERAVEIYAALYEDRDTEWQKHGYRDHGREAYIAALHGLWLEIQEAGFNAAEYYLQRGIAEAERGDEALHNAIGQYARAIALFERFATADGVDAVPDAAWFGAYWAARGIGDATLHMGAGNPSTAQVKHAGERYAQALEIFPFDPGLWASLALSLERQGREDAFLATVRPLSESVERSTAVDGWIRDGKEFAPQVSAVRAAVSHDLALMYLGFADAASLDEIERGIGELIARREDIDRRRNDLTAQLEALGQEREAALADEDPDLPAVSASGGDDRIARISGRIADLDQARERVDAQIDARSRALPLYRSALSGEDIGRALGTQRDHPAHALLRRIYFEGRETQ